MIEQIMNTLKELTENQRTLEDNIDTITIEDKVDTTYIILVVSYVEKLKASVNVWNFVINMKIKIKRTALQKTGIKSDTLNLTISD
jgi:hypothetical protein